MFSLFVMLSQPAVTISETDVAEMRGALAGLSGLESARVMIPDTTPVEHRFSGDGRGPDLALQLYFTERAAADAVLNRQSPLTRLGPLARAPSGAVSHQLMRGRRFPTQAPALPDPCLTFLVTYPGPAENQQLWLDHYDAHHPPIMVRFPGIREVETYRPIDWTSSLPFSRHAAMQRNKVVFDQFADLIASLASPVMLEMSADTKGFPPFTGKTTHFPMKTWRVDGRAGS